MIWEEYEANRNDFRRACNQTKWMSKSSRKLPVTYFFSCFFCLLFTEREKEEAENKVMIFWCKYNIDCTFCMFRKDSSCVHITDQILNNRRKLNFLRKSIKHIIHLWRFYILHLYNAPKKWPRNLIAFSLSLSPSQSVSFHFTRSLHSFTNGWTHRVAPNKYNSFHIHTGIVFCVQCFICNNGILSLFIFDFKAYFQWIFNYI